MIPLTVGVKGYLIYFLFRRELEVVNLSRPDFMDSEIVIWELTSLTDFYKRTHLSLKKDCQKISERKSLFSK